MMNWSDELERIRRFLRDPDGAIWSEDLLLALYNDAQRDIQHKTNVLEDVDAVKVPPQYQWAYLHDWEWAFGEGLRYEALRYHQQGEKIFCHRWESEAMNGLDTDTQDDGTHFIQPWEAWFVPDNPGNIVPLPLPASFGQGKWVGWDKKPLDYLTKKRLTSDDMSWNTHSGEPTHYWRDDVVSNRFFLYPLPSSPVWEDVDLSPNDYDTVYTFSDWETIFITGFYDQFGQEYSNYTYVHDWEKTQLGGGGLWTDQGSMRGMWVDELGEERPEETGYGVIIGEDGSVITGDYGVISEAEESLFSGEHGLVIETIDHDDNVLMIYSVMPNELSEWTDESDYPEFLRKYIEYAVLERAYTVNNDGKIDSLRDYWQQRKELGLLFIKRFMRNRKVDRDYRLITPGAPGRKTRRPPRLPDEYPAI